MKKILILALTGILCLSLTSCIDFLEEITINKDGSGSYYLELNMEKAMEKLAAMMPEEKQAEMKEKGFLKEDDKRELDSLAQVVREQYGVESFEYKAEGLNVQFSFDFENINQAYQTMNTVFGNSDEEGSSKLGGMGGSYMSMEQKGKKVLFSRYSPKKEETVSDEDDEESEKMEAMFMNFMEGGTYESVINFPSKVKVSGNKYASLSDDKKTVIIRASLTDLMENNDIGDFNAKYKIK